MKRLFPAALACLLALAGSGGVAADYDGLDTDLGSLPRLSDAESRSISAENFTGAKGSGGAATQGTGMAAARDLGPGWKVSPAVFVRPGATFPVADIAGPGAIRQIRIAISPLAQSRMLILRAYWDGEANPSIESPIGDFFACGWGKYCEIDSLAVCVGPAGAFNCYWTMPFRRHARITVENIGTADIRFTYQVNYTLTAVPADQAYFHAQFRRTRNVRPGADFTILDGVRGQGQYVGTYLALETHSPGWWGEGEIKFFIDGDRTFPTICGTGTEDYFGGAYNFENRETHRYQPFDSPYSGMPQVLPPEAIYVAGQRFGLYRWHVTDPVRFKRDLRVTLQDLGWQPGEHGRYQLRHDDIASVAYWYQTEPHAPFLPLPSPSDLRVEGP